LVLRNQGPFFTRRRHMKQYVSKEEADKAKKEKERRKKKSGVSKKDLGLTENAKVILE